MSEAWHKTLSNSVTGTTIPLLNISGFLAGEPGALETVAAELRYALENIGFFYLTGHGVPLRGHAQRHTSLNRDPKPNENESFFAKRERDPNDPHVKVGRDLRDPNQWPVDMPGFKDTVLEYQNVMRRLVHKLLPVYARALDLPTDYFK